MNEHSRKHKKKHKKEKKKRKQTSSESEDEWVEKKVAKKEYDVPVKQRDEWMSLEIDFASAGKSDSKKATSDIKKTKSVSEELQVGRSRELNPYWCDGGSGLPPQLKKSSEDRRNIKHDTSPNDMDDTKKFNTKHDVVTHKHGNNEKDNRYNKTESVGKTCHGTKVNKSFKKPLYDLDEIGKRDEESNNRSTAFMSSNKNWKKDHNPREKISEREEISRKSDHFSQSISESPKEENESPEFISNSLLYINKMNRLSAKMIKARMIGDKKLADKLKQQLEIGLKVFTDDETEGDRSTEIIILTETDNKGFSRPLKSVRNERVNAKKKLETHEGKERVRYFTDDDAHTLKDMYEEERFRSSDDQQATFVKLMGKELSKNGVDAFDETASTSSTRQPKEADWNKAIKDHNKREKALENCYWCLDSKHMNQDVIVALKDQVQLCVPSSQSLIKGHCIILPCDHISCATNLDENIWENIMSLRKNLVKLFEEEDQDVIFFESASHLDRHPHMQLHCVPIPKDIALVAPIYFKKAIMESEMEWSNNKKVVDLSGKNVRKAIPKGLPYFAVDFGMQPGYAHVIEDKRLFPDNFAQEIIGGMLDIDHSKWRKLHKDSKENIQEKAKYLKQLIQKYL